MTVPGARSSIATHPQRVQIEARIRKGDPATHIARDHGLSRQAVSRAKVKVLAKPEGQGDGERGVVRGQLMQLFNETTELMRLAKDKGAPRAFLAASAEARRLLNAIDRLMDKLDPAAPAPVAGDVDTHELQQVILAALTPFPAARQAVAKALIAHDAREDGGEK